MLKKLLLPMLLISLFSCKNVYDLPTVQQVDIAKYAGQWYEIARLPNRFEKGLICVTATYSIKENGKITVLNQGYKMINKNEKKSAKGIAWVPDKNYPGRLKVRFFFPFSGDYYIIALNEDYNYALVGDPSRKYLWILSRDKAMDISIYKKLTDIAKTNGFDTEKLVLVEQDCEGSS